MTDDLYYTRQTLDKLACDLLSASIQNCNERGLRTAQQPLNVYMRVDGAIDRPVLAALALVMGRPCKLLPDSPQAATAE